MTITKDICADTLTVCLSGELDHHSATEARKSIDDLIDSEKPKKLLLCLSSVNFCDSSGLGLIMGRYRKARTIGASMALKDPSDAVEKMIRLSGLDKLIQIERSRKNECG